MLRESKLLGTRAPGPAARAPRAARGVRRQAQRAGDREPAAAVAGRGAGARRRGGGGGGAARAARVGAGAGAELDPEPLVAAAAHACSRAWRTGWRPRTPTRCCGSSARRTPTALASVVTLCGRLGLHQAVPGLADTVTHQRSGGAARLGADARPARHAGGARADRQGDRGRRPRRPARRGARGRRRAATRARSSGSRRWCWARDVKEMDLTEKMAFFEAYGVHRGRRRSQGAERHPAAARAAQAQGVAGDPGLRRDRHRQDPDAGGPRDPRARWRTRRTWWSATR